MSSGEIYSIDKGSSTTRTSPKRGDRSGNDLHTIRTPDTPTAPATHPHLRQLPTHLQPSIHPSRNCHHTPTIPSSTHQQARYLNRSPTSQPSSSCQSHLVPITSTCLSHQDINDASSRQKRYNIKIATMLQRHLRRYISISNYQRSKE